MRYVISFFILFVFSGCDELIVKDISEHRMNIIAPVSGSELKTEEVSFIWEPLKGAEEYRIIVVSPSFQEQNRILCDTTVVETSWKSVFPDGAYQWRIQALNSEYGSRIEILSFSIDTVEIEDPEEPEISK